jgi:hypothetical protein
MKRIVLSAALALAVTLPAYAQNGSLTRSFVSSSGVDTNACTITAPCATFAQAYTMVGANGIVAALDPGKYGPITITGPVTINGNGWAAITGPREGTAITISANTNNGDVVNLNGLEIDGAGTATNGIVFNSGGSLTITNCTVQNFYFAGVDLQPASGTISVVITNTNAANNGFGIEYISASNSSATVNAVFDHVVATKNALGVLINNASSGPATFAISNSIASNNVANGRVIGTVGGISVQRSSGAVTVSIDNCNISGNDFGISAQGSASVSIDDSHISSNITGISALDSAKVLLGRSVVTSNTQGIDNETSPNTLYTYQNNQVNLNGNSNQVTGSPLLALPFQ